MDVIDAYPIPGFREPFSCFTHLFAALVFAVLGCILVRRGRGSRDRTISLAILAFSSVFLLSMSGVYHLLGLGAGRHVMKHLDVAGVFVLIAGTVTPVHAILFQGWRRWGPLILVWSVAIIGIALRIVFWDQLASGGGTVLFVLLGWGGSFVFVSLWRRYGFRFVEPLLWGGVSYTVGAVVLVLHWPTLVPGIIGPHELWHLAVLGGIGLHWRFVFQFAAGPPEQRPVKHGNSITRGAKD